MILDELEIMRLTELIADRAAERRHGEYMARAAIVREAKRALSGPLPLRELDRILPAAHPGRAPRKPTMRRKHEDPPESPRKRVEGKVKP